MNTTAPAPTQTVPPSDRLRHRRRRPAWRQRLIDAERGVTLGVRGDSTFFVHFFLTCVVLAVAVVLDISLVEWVLLVLSITLVLSAEMFNQVLKAVWRSVGHYFEADARQALRIATAAVFVTITGAIVAIGLIFARGFLRMLAE